MSGDANAVHDLGGGEDEPMTLDERLAEAVERARETADSAITTSGLGNSYVRRGHKALARYGNLRAAQEKAKHYMTPDERRDFEGEIEALLDAEEDKMSERSVK